MRKVLIGSVVASLLLGGLPEAAAQETACRNEVDRLESAFLPDEGRGQPAAGSAPSDALAGQPGARKDAGLSDAQRDRLRTTIAQARKAAESGDADTCVALLDEARALTREAGIGGATSGVAEGTDDAGRGDGATDMGSDSGGTGGTTGGTTGGGSSGGSGD